MIDLCCTREAGMAAAIFLGTNILRPFPGMMMSRVDTVTSLGRQRIRRFV